MQQLAPEAWVLRLQHDGPCMVSFPLPVSLLPEQVPPKQTIGHQILA